MGAFGLVALGVLATQRGALDSRKHGAAAPKHTLSGSMALFRQRPILLCFAYFCVLTIATIGMQTFLGTSAQRRPTACRSRSPRRAITAYLLGSTAGIARRRLSRRAHGAPRPRRRDRPAVGAVLILSLALFAPLAAWAIPVARADRLRARRHRPVARPDRAQRDAARAPRDASTASSTPASTSAAIARRRCAFGVHARSRLARDWSFVVDRRAALRRDRHRRAGPPRGTRRHRDCRGRRLTEAVHRWISESPGRSALVCAASKGLGRGCAEALAREGVDVTIVARTEADVAAGRRGDRRDGRPRRALGRVRHHDRRRPRAALAACPQPDILVNNAGGPPPGDFRDWDRDAWLRAIDANMLTPIELIKATVDGMIARKFGRIVNITSSRGQGADRHPRTVERRAQRPHRLRRRARAQGRARTT